ncbi:YncE family protein [Streptosporangium carneum]|uniref:YNCE-like beta-propeller domain-containing protein n=1 Tax=Streptosporangium carneum TaxID=47481 RepID=A0A9W6I8T4_9ACTN|nr:YncE family protein [Streptosporangium carneum]GLK14205.1 hypothetical protein GCM10017600_76170 [Streptosporangium carneum]
MRQLENGRRLVASVVLTASTACVLTACGAGAPTSHDSAAHTGPPSPAASADTPGVLPADAVRGAGEADPVDVYAHDRPGMLSPAVRRFPARVYVPNSESDTVSVIDPRTYRVIREFPVHGRPQHVVPSWDLRTLWVNNNDGNTLTPINPMTGRPGKAVPVDDPYNLYFTPNGRTALVMAERNNRLDFRDPRTMRLRRSLSMPCRGINHGDFTVDETVFLASCEFSGQLVVVDVGARKVRSVIDLPGRGVPHSDMRSLGAHHGTAAGTAHEMSSGAARAAGHSSMPQDVKLSPDGTTFYVADMARGGVWLVDAERFRVRRFVRTGAGAHGLYVSRDSRLLYVSNRGAGSVSVISFARRRPVDTWRIPGGGSPDMGGVSADGRRLWLSGRYHGVVYVFDTGSGRLVRKIPVGAGPHGLAVYPQPGRYSLGHTGIFR